MATTPSTIVVFTEDKVNFPTKYVWCKNMETSGDKVFISLSYSPRAATLKRKFGNLPVRYMRVKIDKEQDFKILEKVVRRYRFNLLDEQVEDLHNSRVEGAKMAANHAIKFFMIAKLFHEDPKILQDGENAYTSNHVKFMRYIGNVRPAVLEGQVQARMKKTVYHVQIELDMDSHTIVNHNCSCPRGLDLCHHMAALLYYGHYNISSTDTERQWGVSGRVVTEEEPVLSIDQTFPQKQSYVAIGDPSKLNINKFKSMLGDSNVVGFSWLLKPEANEEMISLIPSIEDILYCQEYIEAEDKQSYVSRQCALNIDQIRKIAAATVGQHSNELWLITRKLRLTSSKFGLILGAYKRNIETEDKVNFPTKYVMVVMKQLFQYGVKNMETSGDKVFISLSYSPRAATLKRKFGNLPVRYMRVKIDKEQDFKILEKVVRRYRFNLLDEQVEDLTTVGWKAVENANCTCNHPPY
nr:unnamed protein product [Callosobruchus analis]